MKLLTSFVLAVAALGPVAAPSIFAQQQPVRVVGTGGRIANNFYTPATANTAFRHRTPHKLGGPVSEMRIGFMDWMYPYEAEAPNTTNDVTISHAWLERASTGQVVPLTFSGSRTLVLPMNSTTPYWLSDLIPSSVWTGAAPARDEVFWLNVRGSIPTGGKIPSGTPTTYAGAKFVVYPPANDPGSFDTTGAVPAITGSATRTAGLPLIVLGRFTGPGHLAVIGIGDSILDGTGDRANPVPVVSGFGFFNRAAVDSNGANAIAMFNLTRHGQSAANFINPARQQRQTHFLPFANVVVEEYGTNDLGSGGTGSTSGILTRTETIWSMARDAGVQKVIRTKLMPRTSSTDAWSTLAGQTPNTGWNAGGKRDIINAGFATALADGKIDVLLDSLATIAAPSDNTRWLTNGTAKYVTTDGTHISPAGNALLAVALRSALLSLTVDDTTPPPGDPVEIIIDNLDSAPRFTKSSGWSSSSASGQHGSNYLHDGDTRDGSRTALFTPVFPATGTYAVSVNWTPHTNRASNTPIDIIHAGGITSFTVNQKSGGSWHPLGTYTFAPDSAHGVFIDNTATDGYVIVDAVKFTPASPTTPGTPGTSFTLQSWTSSPWNAVNLTTSFSAGFSPDDTPVTLTFANPKSGVNVDTPSAPNFTPAANSYFGFEGTGFGVGNNGLGRFDRGESFTLTATHAFELQQITWREWTGDEVLHVKWTSGGVSQEQLFPITAALFAFTGLNADANTPVVITNVSTSTANLTGRLRIENIITALVY
jgi:lysophospholipase L1-like esterase